MPARMTVTFTPCEHGSWSSHNAQILDDGTVVDDDPCDGGIAKLETDPGGRFAIPIILGTILRRWQP